MPWDLNCLDPLFYEIDGSIQTSGYMNGLPSHKLKELLDALNDRFITAIDKGEGQNPCIVLAEKLKNTAFHPKDWFEWFSQANEEITRQNTIILESTRLGMIQRTSSGHDPRVVEDNNTTEHDSVDHDDDDCSISTSVHDIDHVEQTDDNHSVQSKATDQTEHTELVWKFSECYGCGRNNHASSECQLLDNFNRHPDVNTNPDIRWIDSEAGTAWRCIDDRVTVCPRHKTLSGHYFKPSKLWN